MLELSAVDSGYGETQVLYGMEFRAGAGHVLALLGRDGAGKSTTLKTVMGLLPMQRGEVRFDGQPLAGLRPDQIARRGIAYVPETRDIFPSLSVRENLEIAGRISTSAAASAWTMERVLDLFPALAQRLDNGGTQLSGGEQQMLAIARGLLMNPRLLLLDEPTEGLAPIIVRTIHDKLADLKATGLSMLLVEQNFGFATSLADDVAIVGRGRIVWQGTPAAIRSDTHAQHLWLGV